MKGKTSQIWRVVVGSPEEILLTVHSILDNHNISHWLAWGTCLGAVRDGKLIEWDKDIDIGSTDNVSERDMDKITESLADKGYIVAWDMEPDYDCPYSLSVCMLSSIDVKMELTSMHSAKWRMDVGTFTISINFYKTKDGFIRVNTGQVFPERLFITLDPIAFLGGKFLVPSPVEDYLRLCFGKDWRIPKKEGWENDWKKNP